MDADSNAIILILIVKQNICIEFCVQYFTPFKKKKQPLHIKHDIR